jgi:ABC-type Fe3+-hydroxamate transport system substrate-binding protein
VTNIITIEDNFKMTDFGQLFNCRTESQKWNDKIDFAWVILKLYQRHAGNSVFYLENPFMVAGSDTFINELLKLNHFQNIYENKGRYQKSNSKKYV